MNFAIDVVYQYDAEGFQRLRDAFDNGDRIKLAEEWKKATCLEIS